MIHLDQRDFVTLENVKFRGHFLRLDESGELGCSTSEDASGCLFEVFHHLGREVSLKCKVNGLVGFKFSGIPLNGKEVEEKSGHSIFFSKSANDQKLMQRHE